MKPAYFIAIGVIVVSLSVFFVSSCGKDGDLKPNQVSLTSQYVDLKITAKTVPVGEAKAAFSAMLSDTE